MIEIILFVIGVIGLIGGNLTVSKEFPIKGRNARIVGLILMSSLPLSFGFLTLIWKSISAGLIPPQSEVGFIRWSDAISIISIVGALIYLHLTTTGEHSQTPRFWLVAAIPAVGLYVAQNLTILYSSLFDFSMSLKLSLNAKLQIPDVVIGILIPAVITLIVSLALPTVAKILDAFVFAIPVFLVHVYYFSISAWILPGITSIKYPGDTPGAGYQEVINGITYILVSFVLLVIIAVTTWLGAKFRRLLKRKNTVS